MPKRRIGVVTGSRAEYGLLYWLMKEIQDDPELQLQILATGTHLSPEFGLTYRAIEADGFTIDAKVEMLLSSDTPTGIAKSMGLGVIGFSEALDRLKPDILVVLGDRFEILSAAQVALIMRIPLAHISGGELTEGSLDDSIRHAITKMAYFHFPGAEPYRRRIVQMGENPDHVVNYGDIGLDTIRRLTLLSRDILEAELGFCLDGGYFLVTYHPVTLGDKDPSIPMKHLLSALGRFPQKKVIITKPNSDAGGRTLATMVDSYAAAYPQRVYASVSLGQIRYLSAMKYCDIVIGNSSSGIVEAPAMKRGTVNIGFRQAGRLKAASIIDCVEAEGAIADAIEKALSPEFAQIVCRSESLYGKDDTSRRIKAFLREADLTRGVGKVFHDWPCETSKP